MWVIQKNLPKTVIAKETFEPPGVLGGYGFSFNLIRLYLAEISVWKILLGNNAMKI